MDLSSLNEEQHKAVMHGDGPTIIFAGAGTGKTRTLTHRIAYLIREKGVPADKIFATTFTRDAAREMKRRVKLLVGASAEKSQISTFHSFCFTLVNKYKKNLGIPQIDLLTNILKEREVKEDQFIQQIMQQMDIKLDVEDIRGKISAIKISGKNIEEFSPEEQRVYYGYQKYLDNNKLLDFDDLLVKSVNLLKSNNVIRNHWNQCFSHILVDEFQDTNQAQYDLVRLLAERHHNICAVGDDDQTIYSFAGADVKRMLNFTKDYPEAVTFHLGQNYRSTGNIIDIANRVISRNVTRKRKELRTDKALGAEVMFQPADSREDEARWVAEQISALHRQGVRYSKMRILSRRTPIYHEGEKNKFTTSPYEREFLKEGIPPISCRLYERSEITNLILYLRAIYDLERDEALFEIINIPPRGIEAKSIKSLKKDVYLKGSSLLKVLSGLEGDARFSTEEIGNLQAFADLLKKLRRMVLKTRSIHDLLECIVRETNYREYLHSDNAKYAYYHIRNAKYAYYHIRNVDEFIDRSASFDEGDACKNADGVSYIKHFLDLITPKKGADKVNWMTLHKAKGLEFPNVFLVGVNNNIFPDERNELEEERRLFYVGITRAQERLFISTSAFSRFINEANQSPASTEVILSPIHNAMECHLEEEEVTQTSDVAIAAKVLLRASPEKQLQLTQPKEEPIDTPPEEETLSHPVYRVGDRVRHKKFGDGKVIEVLPSNEVKVNDKIIIHFDQGERKKLALQFVLEKALLQKID